MLLADVVWPGLLLEMRLMAWWIIVIGLLVEWPFVRLVTDFSWTKAFFADVMMNTASTILGVFLLPIAGIAWEVVSETTFHHHFSSDTFNLIRWSGTFLLAVVLSTTIELLVLMSLTDRVGARSFWWLCLANSISTGLGLWSLFQFPPRA